MTKLYNKIYLTGDTHIPHDIHKLSYKNWPESRSLTGGDVLIILGDFGLIWSLVQDKVEEYWEKWLCGRPYTILFIDGNHENFKRLYEYPTTQLYGGTVGVITENIFHLKRGEVYTINGRKIFTLGGAKSHDKDAQKIIPDMYGVSKIKTGREEGIDWWPEEEPNGDELNYAWSNLEKHNFEVDYILTHCPPTAFTIPSEFRHKAATGTFAILLNDIYRGVNFKKWYFGHMHEDFQNHHKLICLFQKIIEIGQDLPIEEEET